MICKFCKNTLLIYNDANTQQHSIRCIKCLLSTEWHDDTSIAQQAWEDGDVVTISHPNDFISIRRSKSNYAIKQKEMQDIIADGMRLEPEEEFDMEDLRKK